MPSLKYLLLSLFLLVLFSPIGRAQTTYTGVVIDLQKGKPIEYVLVRSAVSKSVATFTNGDGEFSISDKQARFEFSVAGFETQLVDLHSGRNVIALKETEGYLNQVVVSGSKSGKKYELVTSSLEIIKPELVDKKNVIKAENVLQQVSSLSVTDKQVNIRNSSGWSYGAGSRVMVLQDGMPMLSGDAGQPQWTFINTDNIRNIEVVKGASSVLYGSSALGGIVHLQTALPSDDPKTSISAFSGVYSKPERSTLHWTGSQLAQHGLRLFDSRKVGRLDLVSNLQLITDDGYRMGDYEDRFRAGGLMRYRLSDSSILSLNAQVMANRSASFLLWVSYDSAYTALDGDFNENRGLRILIDPKYVKYHKQGKQLIQGRYFRIKNDISGEDTGNDQSNSSHVYYLEYQFHHKIRAINAKIIGGLVYQLTESASPLFQGDHSSENRAAFLQLEKNLGRLLLTGGARYETYALDNYEESKPVMRVGANYRGKKARFFRASYGQGYRFPTIAESFIRTSVGDLSIFPNDSLKSEFGTNIELGLKQGWKTKWARGFIDFAVFRMEYDDMMEFSFSQWSKEGLGLGFKSINVGKTQITGAEVSAAGTWIHRRHKITFFGGYTYTNPISLEPAKVVATNVYGIPLSYDSTSSDPSKNALKYRYRHLVRFDLQYSYGGFDIGLSTRYNSYMENIDRAFVSFPINLFVLGIDESRKQNLSGDLVFDLRLVYTFKKLQFGLNVLNLMNREVYSRPADMGPPRYSNLAMRYQI